MKLQVDEAGRQAKAVANGLPKPSTKPTARPARRSTACASSISRMCSRARPARSCSAYMGADCHQGRAPGRRRHHARAVARREGRGHASTSRCSTATSARSRSTPSIRKGKEILERLIKHCDVLVENFAPGALDRMGLTWEHIHKTQPAHDRGVGEGLRSRPLRGLQGLRERRAMRRRLGLHHRLPRGPAAGHRRADRRQRAPACISRSASSRALYQRIAHRPRPAACCARCRTACSTSRA